MRAARAAVAAVAVLAPKVALACPACAGRDEGGLTTIYLMGLMILFPFAVALVGWRVLRQLNLADGTES